MMATKPRAWSVEEFLAWENAQAEKYEFVNGIITMMTGGTLAHSLISANIIARLHAALRGGPCRVLSGDARVIGAVSSTYPDAVVTCSLLNPRDLAVPEPRVIVEVLSRSTVARDYGPKLLAYQSIASLQHYLLVSQDEWLAEMFSREPDGWRQRRYAAADAAVDLPAIGARLTLAEIYDSTSLAPA